MCNFSLSVNQRYLDELHLYPNQHMAIITTFFTSLLRRWGCPCHLPRQYFYLPGTNRLGTHKKILPDRHSDPSRAKPGQAELSQARPGQAKPVAHPAETTRRKAPPLYFLLYPTRISHPKRPVPPFSSSHPPLSFLFSLPSLPSPPRRSLFQALQQAVPRGESLLRHVRHSLQRRLHAALQPRPQRRRA